MSTPYDCAHLLNPLKLRELAQAWIDEDVSSFDIQGYLVGDSPMTASIICKTNATTEESPIPLAGRPFVEAICQQLSINSDFHYTDGQLLDAPSSGHSKIEVATLSGPARNVLLAERTVLNILARCTGIARQARSLRTRLDSEHGWFHGQLVGTRKTTPGFRLAEKYSLLVGGAGTHRYDLSSLVMLKDNHHDAIVQSGKPLRQAIAEARRMAGFTTKIEMEARSEEEALALASLDVDIVMLDNFTPPEAIRVAGLLKTKHPDLLIEASGGINASNVADYAHPCIDIISMSCLVQSYPVVDFSMNVLKS